MKLLDLSNIEAFNRLDEDWRTRIKPVDDPEADLAYEYASSSGKRVYRVYLHREVSSWYGSCSCPGGSRKRAEPVPPCKHIAAALLLQPDFDSGGGEVPEEISETPVTKEPEKTDEMTKAATISARSYLNGAKKPPSENVHVEQIKAKIVWPSAVPLMEACPASLEDTEIKIDRIGEPARLGRAVHSICEEIVRLERIPDIRPYALENNIESEIEDLNFLARSALRLWKGTKEIKGLKEYFRNPSCEVTSDFQFQARDRGRPISVTIHGRADVQEIFDDYAVVLDWKSGRKHDEYNYLGQMKSLAILAAAQSKKIKKVSTILAWLRDGTISPIITFTREELKDWLIRFAKHDLFWDGMTYRPGLHCRFCPRYLDCPARKEMLSQSIALFSDSAVIEKPINWLKEPEKLAVAIDHARLIGHIARDFVERAKEALEKHEPIPIPGKPGYGYAVVEEAGRTAVDPQKAWPLLSETLDDDEIAHCVSISLGGVKKALMKKAPRGQKAALMQEVINKLEEAGALVHGAPIKSLKVIKIEKEGK